MHPEVHARLREEIFTVVGKDRAPSLGMLVVRAMGQLMTDLHLCLDDLRSMKYLRAVLNETLRLFR